MSFKEVLIVSTRLKRDKTLSEKMSREFRLSLDLIRPELLEWDHDEWYTFTHETEIPWAYR